MLGAGMLNDEKNEKQSLERHKMRLCALVLPLRLLKIIMRINVGDH